MITVKELYQNALDKKYNNSHDQFLSDAEEAFGIKEMPQNVKDKIHWYAWDRGHSSGYYEVVSCYHSYVEVAKACYGKT